MLFNFLNFTKIRVLAFVFLASTATFSLQALPEQITCEKITALARAAMIVWSSVNKTENPKLDFATNAVRCLNSMTRNYYGKDSVLSKEEQKAQLSFVASMIADIVKPEKLIDGKVTPKKQRTNARRAVLTMLALAESIPAILVAFRGLNHSRMELKTAINLSDLSAFAAVVHSIAATDDKYTKAVHASVLAMMLYSWTKGHVFAAAEASKDKEYGVSEVHPAPAENPSTSALFSREIFAQQEEQAIEREQCVDKVTQTYPMSDGFKEYGHVLQSDPSRMCTWIRVPALGSREFIQADCYRPVPDKTGWIRIERKACPVACAQTQTLLQVVDPSAAEEGWSVHPHAQKVYEMYMVSCIRAPRR